MASEHRDWIRSALEKLKAQASQFAIFVIANIKNVTVVDDDYAGFSVHNDYMTEQVINEIIGSLRDFGTYVRLFVGEDAFLRAVLDGEIDEIRRPKKFVYNLAQTGTGPARKALIPTFCNLHHLPYGNSDGHVVALLRHKYHATSILRDHGFPVPRTWFYLQTGTWLQNERPPNGLKVIVKATYEAASIGLSKECVRTCDQYLEEFARNHSQTLRQPLTVQEFIEGYEIEVPVFSAPDAYAPGAVGVSIRGTRRLGDNFLDYHCLDDRAYDFFDFVEENKELSTKLRSVTEKAATVLGIAGVGRIDYRAIPAGSFYITDMQTMPDIYVQSSVQFVLTRYIINHDPYAALVALNCQRLGLL